MDAPRKLYQRIAAELAADISKNVFATGSRMPAERDLAEMYKVSRPTIREAMIALEIRGWVEARQGSGLYVTDRDHGSAKEEALELDVGAFDVTEARVLFEGEAAALAAQSITAQQIAELEEALEVLADPLTTRPAEAGGGPSLSRHRGGSDRQRRDPQRRRLPLEHASQLATVRRNLRTGGEDAESIRWPTSIARSPTP